MMAWSKNAIKTVNESQLYVLTKFDKPQYFSDLTVLFDDSENS